MASFLNSLSNCRELCVAVTKSRTLRWAGHVARMGSGEVHIRFWWGKLIEGDHLEDAGLDEDNIKMDLRDVRWEHGLDRSGSG